MTVSEFTLYSLMRTISEYELLEIRYKNKQMFNSAIKNYIFADMCI